MVIKKIAKMLLVGALAFGAVIPYQVQIQANETNQQQEEEEYLIYPKPQTMEYQEGSYILRSDINVIYDEEIDTYTKDRMKEVAALKNLHVHESTEAVEGMTNIYVGVFGSQGKAAAYINEQYHPEASLFEKTDAYFAASDNNVLSVMGKNTDASFYGLTSLYHVFAQMDSLTIRNFTIEDYADVVSRGFIEGYYGNPWSVEDRSDLMTFGGYYKMNAYFYAPKDDEKHRVKWAELYTEDELKNIKQLAEAGNASKCRYVYALHPFPKDNHFRFDTEATYQEDLAKVKAKFQQVIDQGVRQIAILADDFYNPGGTNGLRLINDMTAWLKEVQKEYPDMVMTMPYVPFEYGSYGAGSEIQTLKNAPDNVQLVMTGGGVWGEVSENFTSTFTKNVGRGPFMWINWPCSDNSKNHLIMGGNETFLHPGVDPSNIQGIMLNPMQESEPSKVAIFANAAYAWNIWDTSEEAQKAWDDSFAFVDHNSAIPTEGSEAYKELSKHMINQNMDNRVKVLQESVDLKPALDAFKQKLNNATLTLEETDAMIAEFTTLQKAASTYRNKTGNTRTRDQIVYWLDCWDDTTAAAIAYLKGVKSVINGDTTGIINYSKEGKTAFEHSKTHAFWYREHYEYAEVGVQHIVPFINTLGTYLSNASESILDPSRIIQTFITSRSDNPVGSTDNALDGDDSTQVSYRNPVWIKAGEYVGVSYNKPIEVNSIRFLLGNGKNHFEQSKLQYTLDGKEWLDVNDETYTAVQGQYLDVKVQNLKLKAAGIRLIATADNTKDAYLNVHEIQINQDAPQEPEAQRYTGSVTYEKLSVQGGNEAAYFDGNASTEVMLAKGPYEGADRDTIPAGAYLTVTFDEAKTIGSVSLTQGTSSAGDVFTNADVLVEQNGIWKKVGTFDNSKKQTVSTGVLDNVTAVRIMNQTSIPVWVRIGEIDIRAPKEGEVPAVGKEHVYTNIETNDVTADVSMEGKATLSDSQLTLQKDQYMGIKLDHIMTIRDVVNSEALPASTVVEVSMNGIEWATFAEGMDARYIRIRANENQTILTLKDFCVSYDFIAARSISSDFANQSAADDVRSKNNLNHAFDGDLSTAITIAGPQKAGKHITFDLGQQIDFSSLRYYINENSLNYLRYAKFEVADRADAQQWTTVLTLGDDSFQNVWDESVAKNASYLTHDAKNPGNMYAESTGLQVRGRYLRVTPLKDYDYRWVQFSEIQINEGAYITTESTKDIVSADIEENGKVPSNMLDGDFTTVYKSSAANSSFTYRISQPTGKSSIRLIQNGEVSNALVTARVYREADSTIQEVELGTLNQVINEFAIANGFVLLDVTITWEDRIPELSEISLGNIVQGDVDKAALEAELQKDGDASWTKNSMVAYQAAKDIAQNVYENAYVTQDAVDMALGSLRAARNNAIEKADATTLQKAYDERVSNDGEVQIYTSRSYAAYASVIESIADALADVESLSKTNAEALEMQLQKAIAGLEYSKIQSELAQITLASDEGTYVEGDYSTVTYTAYQNAKTALHDAIEADKSERMHPEKIADLRTAYDTAKAALADVRELKQQITHEDQYVEANYTQDSWTVYTQALAAAKQALMDGTLQTVSTVLKALQDAEAQLIPVASDDAQKLLDEVKKLKKDNYTEASYQKLAEAIAKAEEEIKLGDPSVNEKIVQYISAARAELISVEQLNIALAVSGVYREADYTKDSYRPLKEAMDGAAIVKVNGSKEQVQSAADAIMKAIAQLVVNAKDLEAYRNAIEVKEAYLYTVESYAAYKNAYDTLMAMEIGNTSMEAFTTAKTAFENAEAALVKIEGTEFTKQLLHHAIVKAEAIMAKDDFKLLAPKVQTMIITYTKEANTVYQNTNATNQECLDAWLHLADALHYADFKADKEMLKELISECEQLDTSKYEEGVEAFKAALKAAQAVAADANVLQESIDKAYATLLAAKDALQEKPTTADKSILQDIMKVAEKAIQNPNAYKHDTYWDAFLEAWNTAEKVMADEQATQANINAAASALSGAYENIRLLPDEDLLKKLEDFIQQAVSINRQLYSKENLAYIDEALASAKAILKGEGYTAAYLNTVSKKVDKAIDIIENEKLSNPGITQPGDGQSNKPNQNHGNNNSVHSGDTSDAQTAQGVLLVSMLMMGAVMILRKKKHVEK